MISFSNGVKLRSKHKTLVAPPLLLIFFTTGACKLLLLEAILIIELLILPIKRGW